MPHRVSCKAFQRRDGDSNPRTLDRGLTVFETAAFDHSAISPFRKGVQIYKLFPLSKYNNLINLLR